MRRGTALGPDNNLWRSNNNTIVVLTAGNSVFCRIKAPKLANGLIIL